MYLTYSTGGGGGGAEAPKAPPPPLNQPLLDDKNAS